MNSIYQVVRLDYSICDSRGNPHQTHQFTRHRTLAAATKSALKHQKKYNCIDIVDESGSKIEWFHLT